MFSHKKTSIAAARRDSRKAIEERDLERDEVVPTTATHLAAGGLVLAGILSLAVICTPHATTPLPAIPGFFTSFATAMILLNMHAGFAMLNRGSFESRGAATALGSTYLMVGGIFVPFLASFPDAIISGRLLGSASTALLLWACWHFTFALSIARYALLAKDDAEGPSVRRACVEILAVIGGSIAISLYFSDTIYVLSPKDGSHYFPDGGQIIPEIGLVLSLVSLALCLRLRARTTEELYVTLSMAAACLDVWLTMRAESRFSLGWYVAKGSSLLSTLCATGFLTNETLRLYRRNAETSVLLKRLVCVDGLTGIANRRRLDDALNVEWRRARRDRTPMSVLLMDVDWFKAFNDKYGHPAGDDCLREVARCVAQAVHRPADLVARYGGEEFAVLLPDTDEAGSMIIAERVKSAVEELRLVHEGSRFGCVTLSVGAATRIPDRDGGPESLIADADAALYRAKGMGRNCVGSAGRTAMEPSAWPQVPSEARGLAQHPWQP